MKKNPYIPLITAVSIIVIGIILFRYDPDGLSTCIYLSVIILFPLVLYKRGIRQVDREFPFNLFIAAFLAKLAGSSLRYWVMVDVYTRADAIMYHAEGQVVARYFRDLDFSMLFSGRSITGTAGVKYLVGSLYSVFPPSMLGSFYFFAAMAFIGSVFFYRAFRIGFPDVSPKFYRIVVFFLPSILFWPSSLGKDAWVFFGTGVAVYGLSGFYRRPVIRWLVWIAIGLALITIVRPHIAGFLAVAAAGAYLISFRLRSIGSMGVWLVGGVAFIFIGFFVLSQSKEFLMNSGLGGGSWEEMDTFYMFRRGTSLAGGSKFIPPILIAPLGPVFAVVTALFRPFPWEVHNVQAMVSSIESLVWLGIFVKYRRKFLSKLKSIRTNPLVTFCIFYVLIICFALTIASNFGIIARQRVMFLPLLWMLF